MQQIQTEDYSEELLKNLCEYFTFRSFYTGQEPTATIPVLENIEDFISVIKQQIASAKNPAIMLSGGMDSAVLVPFMPKGATAYTIYHEQLSKNEIELAASYAAKFGLKHVIIPINEQNYFKHIDSLIINKRMPLSPAEPIFHIAAKKAYEDGYGSIVTGAGADAKWGGFPRLRKNVNCISYKKLLQKAYLNPDDILKKAIDVSPVFSNFLFINKRGVEVVSSRAFLRDVSVERFAYNNAIESAGCWHIAPFTSAVIRFNHKKNRVDPKYLIKDLYHQIYGKLPQKKFVLQKPTYLLKDYRPIHKFFNPSYAYESLHYNKKVLVYFAERYLNLIDQGLINQPEKVLISNKDKFESIVKYNPQVIIAWPEKISLSQLSIWEPYLLKSRFRVAITTRSIGGKNLKTSLPVFSECDGFTIGQIGKIKSLRAILYPGNKSRAFRYFNQFPRYTNKANDVVHILLNHGESDKASSASRYSKVYDYLFVADSQARSRYRGRYFSLPKSSFFRIGATVYEGIEPRLERTPKLNNILYAPTWEGWRDSSNYSSFALVYEKIEHLKSGGSFNFQYRLHPGTGLRLDNFLELKKKIKSDNNKKVSKVDAFNWADCIITDISGVLAEFLFTGKPIIVPYNPDNKVMVKAFSQSSLKGAVYKWDIEKEDLLSAIHNAEKDFEYGKRLKFRSKKFFGIKSAKESWERFDWALLRAIRGGTELFPFSLYKAFWYVAKKLYRRFYL